MLSIKFTLLACFVALAALADAAPISGNGRTQNKPGRVLTKTYTYDSTRDPYDPCNPVTGDQEKCLNSMADDVYPTYNPPTGDVYHEAEYANAASAAADTDFDLVYSRPPKARQMKGKQY